MLRRPAELTEAGWLYFERCKRIVDEASLAQEQLGELLAQPSGVLRASLAVNFATIYRAQVGKRYPHKVRRTHWKPCAKARRR